MHSNIPLTVLNLRDDFDMRALRTQHITDVPDILAASNKALSLALIFSTRKIGRVLRLGVA